MPLAPGTKLGPYEIVGPLGAGGMGEVYRGHDPRLNRDVAIKTLPTNFADDSNRLARLQREAQVLASLNHSNIAAIYGIEEEQGVRALVMELVEGPTLADRIAAGPIPLAEVLAIARQIGDALEAAHEKGVIHRDLKPANIKLTPEGKVKVLDFGLAKAFDPETASGSNPPSSMTMTLDGTRAGMILGTAGYMSPEQARGKPVDKRADIWAFGVVLYEMLTGKLTFDGETVSDTLAAVLRADIEWNRLPAGTPPKVKRLVQRCLERDLRKRLRDIGDAWIEIDAPEDAAPAANAPVTATSTRASWLPWAAGAVFALAGVTWGVFHTSAEPPRPVMRWSYNQKEYFGVPMLSRDGKYMAYGEVAGNSSRLMLRALDQPEGKPLPGGEDAFYSTFSPDGQWLAFVAGQNNPWKLKKVSVTGGTPITLSEAYGPSGLDWGDNGDIAIASRTGLMHLPPSGGTPQALTTVDTKGGETSHAFPHYLPGAQGLLFTINRSSTQDAGVADLKTGAHRVLIADALCPRYVPTGHIVFLRRGALFAAPFNLRRMEVTGPEVQVIDDVASNGQRGIAEYSLASAGLLVYMTGARTSGKTVLHWVDRRGALEAITDPELWGTGRLSPDGRRVANEIYGTDQTNGDIWVFDIERRTKTRLSFGGDNRFPIWSQGGKTITFGAMVSGKTGIYTVPADGSGKPQLLASADFTPRPMSWSPDGKVLIYSITGADRIERLWSLPVSAGVAGKAAPLHDTTFPETSAAISPDGKWLAYASLETGSSDVYVQPFPGPGAKTRISTDMGFDARWSRDGRELFYRSIGNKMMQVEVRPGAAFDAGIPSMIFQQETGTTWDVAPDGKRFLIELNPNSLTSRRHLEAVVNWFDELRARVPGK